MKSRVLTGIVIALVFIPLFIIGKVPLNVLMLLLTMGASYELFNMFNKDKKLTTFIQILHVVLAGGMYYLIQLYYLGNIQLEWVFLGIIGVVVIGAMILVFCEQFEASNYGEMFVTVLYPSLGFGAIFALRSFHLENIGFLFMITIMTDVFAYIVGINFGKHRLAVKISPKKSIEGSIGGTFFAVVLTLVYLYAFNITEIAGIQLTILISIGLIILLSIFGQIGDLVASKMKRSYGIKDFSQIFPGHGGILDRFDSAVFTAMVLMLISKIVGIL